MIGKKLTTTKNGRKITCQTREKRRVSMPINFHLVFATTNAVNGKSLFLSALCTVYMFCSPTLTINLLATHGKNVLSMEGIMQLLVTICSFRWEHYSSTSRDARRFPTNTGLLSESSSALRFSIASVLTL